MKKILNSVFAITIIFLNFLINCEAETRVRVEEEGYITFFEEGLRYPDNGRIVLAGTSTVVFDGERLIFGNDKPIPGRFRSQAMYIDFPGSVDLGGVIKEKRFDEMKVYFYLQEPFFQCLKYECSTITPDHRYVIMSTGFTSVGEVEIHEIPFCLMHIHPVGKPEKVKVVHERRCDNYLTTRKVRECISQLLVCDDYPEGPNYINMEGLSAIPGGKLLMGLRQYGHGYDDFEYRMKIIEVSYEITEDGELLLGDDYRIVYDFNPREMDQIQPGIGVSSLEYDKFNERLYIVGAYEFEDKCDSDDVGAYLFVLTLDEMYEGKAPRMVCDERGKFLEFPHKIEGLAVIDKNHIFLVADDDGIMGKEFIIDPKRDFSRKLNEAAYYYLEVSDV